MGAGVIESRRLPGNEVEYQTRISTKYSHSEPIASSVSAFPGLGSSPLPSVQEAEAAWIPSPHRAASAREAEGERRRQEGVEVP